MKIGVDFIALISLLYLFDNDGILIFALIAAAIHEIGHIIAMKLCKVKIERITLGWYGARIEMSTEKLISYKKEIIIALAGPVFGGITAVLTSRVGNDACTLIAGFSAILTAFNLLPAGILDGGRAIKYAALMLFNEKIQRITSITGNLISTLLLTALCIYTSIKIGVSPGLCTFCAFVSGSFLKELFE